MKPKIILCSALVATGGLFGCSRAVPHRSAMAAEIDTNLTTQIFDILKECQKIKRGMTRADLAQGFETEGGFHSANHQTFVHHRCPLIKIDIDFNVATPKQKGKYEEQTTDTISEVSKPYLAWSVWD